MAEFIVLEAGDDGIFAAVILRAGRECCVMPSGLDKSYGLWSATGVKLGEMSWQTFSRFGSSNASMRVAMPWSVRMKDRRAVFARDVDGFNRRVKTIFHAGRRDDDAR